MATASQTYLGYHDEAFDAALEAAFKAGARPLDTRTRSQRRSDADRAAGEDYHNEILLAQRELREPQSDGIPVAG